MNNVIVLLIDSVFSETLSSNKTDISVTPFIDSLKEKAIFAPNVYSYGPYTDAASKALYCGNRTLDDFGYFFGLNSSEYNHFRVFKENGYETFGVYYPYYLLSSKVEKDIDHSLYTSGFKYLSVWGGKFEYYAEEQKKRNLTEQEYTILIKCMEMVFNCWNVFYENIDNKPGAADITKTIFNKNLGGTGRDGLALEQKKFNDAPKEYIDEILKQGMTHPLAKINEYAYGREEDIAFIREVYEKNNKFFKDASRVNTVRNLVNNPLNIKKSFDCIASFIKSKNKSDLRYFGNYGMLLGYTELMKKRSLMSGWQDMSSLYKQIEILLNNLDRREENSENPFYASLHALEPHHNMSLFSYDSFDHELIREEIEYMYPVIKGCGKKFAGNLIYSLSLRYVDLCVKRLFEQLEKRNLLENTTVMLVSDHGTSYFFDPVRNYVVNTFHKENYNIPMLIWDKKMPEEVVGTYSGLYSSDDIYPTLCDVVGVDVPDSFTGSSIIKNIDGREYVIVEYMGPGVPDMLHKEVWIAIRNKKYVIAYKNPISKELALDKPFCIYDLTSDPFEKKNCVGFIADNDEIKMMKSILNERFFEIQEDTKKYLAKIG